jgi:phosphoglycolate phosphatase
MRTALGAGLFPIGVSWGFRQVEEIVQAGAQAICNTSEELTVLLSD